MLRQKTFNTYRQTYPLFVYDGFHYDVQPDGLHIAFSFWIGDRSGRHPLAFHPTAFVPARHFLLFDQPREVLDALVFHIGMAELVSYWKCFCPPQVEVRCGCLDDNETTFWRKLYWHGLGEFFYTNGIATTETEFMTLTTTGSERRIMQPVMTNSHTDGCLVPIGGGKDSVVSLELLREAGRTVRPLILNPRGATRACAAVAGFGDDDTLVIQRTLDPLMLQLNSQGCLNGHTPFSAMLAFYTLLAAQLSGVPDIALSNESSANESTVIGTSVNHQYSKSLEFEADFRHYVRHAFADNYNYFSLLRPLSELQIAMLFARADRYHDVFRSCNVGSKQDIWCGRCAKCLFAYIILSPFIAPERMSAIFGKAMLDDLQLEPLLRELMGRTDAKPFECVGTVSEVCAAITLTRHRWYHDRPLPALLTDERLQDVDLPTVAAAQSLLSVTGTHHFVAPELMDTLKKRLSYSFYRSDRLREMMQGRRILLAGYGREGQSTHRLLQWLDDSITIDIAHDSAEIEQRLTDGTAYDWVVKSPGVPMSQVTSHFDATHVTSQTDLFLRLYADQTIGVTGTKGKSTTTTLIGHILKASLPSCRKVLVAGNMGLPLFDIVDQLDADAVVVAELSCHQLQGIHRAPHIGLILNLYQEHLDHYDSYRDYQMAKMQLLLRQQPGDHAFYCTDSSDLVSLVTTLRDELHGEVVAYSAADAEEEKGWSCRLVGAHNRSNIHVACLVAALMGVDKEACRTAVATFEGLPHRLQYVGCYRGIHFYNDSIATIPEATVAALQALPDVQTLILGGYDRGIDYSPLARYTRQCTALQNIVYVGQAGKRIAEAMADQNKDRQMLFSDDYRQIVGWCYAHTDTDMCCLLSPAAASYDAFTNFEHRGDTFCQLVRALADPSSNAES